MTSSPGFVAARLRIARQRRGYTKVRLAGLCGVDSGTVTRWENDRTVPDDDAVTRLGQVLGFPKGYFYRDEPPEVGAGRPSFRALSSMTAQIRDRALGAASLGIEFGKELTRHFNLPSVNVPDLAHLDPEGAAEALREVWGLGVKPIKNMVHLVEKHGVRVFSLNEDATSIHAFCVWEEDLPFVFLSRNRTVERSRYNCAHELGHLVLHRERDCTGPEAEKEANQFASAFLMPRESIRATCCQGMTFLQVVAQKQRWGVAAAALAYRLHSPEINLLSDWQYKRIAIEISRRGRLTEPEPIEGEEVSLVLRLVFQALAEKRISLQTIARDLCFPENDLSELTFGLGLSLVGGTNSPGTSAPVQRGVPVLTRIK
jgi:Zn-dependent peptidase ImmA (M78 family)/DNA-binding XRE family transcriptional regulator